MAYIVSNILLEKDLEELRQQGVDASLASGGGRMHVTMDHYENDWNLVKRGWDAQVLGEPPHKFKSVVTFDFRADRKIMLAKALEYANFDNFDRVRVPKIHYAGMLQYDGELKLPSKYSVSPPEIDRTSGEYFAKKGLRTFACSETMKFGHVTFFWNGNRSGLFESKLETYVEIIKIIKITLNELHSDMDKTKVLWSFSISAFLINLAAVMERADETIMPAVYKEVGQDFGASPSQLGYLSFIRAFTQSLSSPLAGILSLRYSRPSVVGIGTLFWAFSTVGVAISQNLFQCGVWRAINGIGLAIVIPSLNSFIADSNSEEGRGLAFGWLSLVGCIGGIGGGMLATILAGHTFGGYAGWRVAHILVAIVSTIIGLLVHFFVVDPKVSGRTTGARMLHEGKDDVEHIPILSPSMWKDSLHAIRTVLRIRSFQIIVLQGLVGSIPWAAMVFFTMWFELIGFGHEGAASLMGIFVTGCAFGSLFGGWVADKATKHYPFIGRVMSAQFSAFMGIPFSWFLLVALPQDSERWYLYATTLACMGLTITLAAPAVGLLAEKVFGYRVNKVVADSGSQVEAVALSRGLFTVMAIPFALCSLFYTPLYVTYKRDYNDVNNSTYYVDEEGVYKRAVE
ncbi:hypothetical protein GOP47_0000397 [Adiantum capillus-veneris]|uniref:Major facilitator superfamily (MFS) profile domain-containing protein n=1 Tax=Adiantum capillus-veneris TaxID=13818 RepID=A0A9D4VEW5_ADICA|nr:hypothetical protein GOP47_0000397 [Adiantum capillus-veneris]